ncbi:tyrosine-protein kinase SRK2 isoform X2 [Eurytemora carolleeae]|uniref:tyrosine-protein kinase SRK2 isoform X2 n=1 Tax=Eurytemora carolleeae TaxID=1294199 RepID=UPI000C75E3B6|nr:tyrosine-protein kinase SRK2 isoform X2 [Eurytemora carolleeae]|eukprot:XP_023344030.1 tyrosine-protein kinase SRK2-like isoform X2 [Eurytemora affinis]
MGVGCSKLRKGKCDVYVAKQQATIWNSQTSFSVLNPKTEVVVLDYSAVLQHDIPFWRVKEKKGKKEGIVCSLYFANEDDKFKTLDQLIVHCSTNIQKGLPAKLMYICLIPNPSMNSEADIQRVPYEELEFSTENEIGKGEFGKVYKGTLRGLSEVAIKELKIGKRLTAREKAVVEDNFKEELKIQRSLRHPNIVTLIAFVESPEHGNYMIQEYMEKGDLTKYIREKSKLESIRLRSLVAWCYEIALGMKYLSSQNIIHRDLAGRNVLVDKYERAKVADFGLARDQQDDQRREEKIPIRWSPPEVFNKREYSDKSDVWSYGVTLWEIFSYGAKPYDKLNKEKYKDHIISGRRLEFPYEKHTQNSTRVLKPYDDLMKICWKKNPMDRPNFKDIVKKTKVEMNDYNNDYYDLGE